MGKRKQSERKNKKLEEESSSDEVGASVGSKGHYLKLLRT